MKRIMILTAMTLLISVHTLPAIHANTTTADIPYVDVFWNPQVTIPADPSNLAAMGISSSSITISWADNSTDEEGFKIERCSGANCTDFQLLGTMPAGVTSITDWGLGKNKTFNYRVCAYNAAGDSGYTNTAAATTSR